MNLIKKIIKILILLLFANGMFAQDMHFSQFYATPLYLAPSFAGTSSKKSRLALSSRNQWPEIKNAFASTSFSFDHYFSEIRSGLGVLFMRDVSGDGQLRRTNIGTQYSFDFRIFEYLHLRPGTYIYYTQTGLDFSKLTFYDEIVYNREGSTATEPRESKGDVDFATSLLGYSETFWFGFTIDHLLRSNQSLYDKALTPMKYAVFGGVRVSLNEKLLLSFEESLTLTFLYHQQADYRQLQLGSYYHKNPLVFGMWYRGIPIFSGDYPGSDALVFLTGYKIDNLSLGYSYDFTVSRLRSRSGGAHELSVIFNFKIRQWRKKPTAIPCPEF